MFRCSEAKWHRLAASANRATRPVLILSRPQGNLNVMPIEPRRRARLIPELLVSDIAISLRFWCGVLGFAIKYDRPEEGFAYLELAGAEVMLEQRAPVRTEREAAWETGPMERPFGRGINLEIQVDDLTWHTAHLESAGVALRLGPEEKWYRAGDNETGVRQLLVQDPDGYLIRLQQTDRKSVV